MFNSEYPFVRILLPSICGIIAFYSFTPDKPIWFVLAFPVLLLAGIIFFHFGYRRIRIYKHKYATGILITLIFFYLGAMLCLLNNDKIYPDYFEREKPSQLKVWIINEPQKTGDILRFKVKVLSGYLKNTQIKLSGQLLIALKLNDVNPVDLNYGDVLIIPAIYTAVEPAFNPAEFDFKSWLAIQNVYAQTFINQKKIIKTQQLKGNYFIKLAIETRKEQVLRYRKLLKNNENFAVAATLILGYRASLSRETLADYAKTGTIHALSVSGSHVAIIFFLLDFCLIFPDKKVFRLLKFIIICVLIWSYALITGFSPSVVRSAIMISIFIAAKTFSRSKNSYNILAFAAFCQLTDNPYLIWDVGFQLSYLSVFGLIYLQPKINNWLFVPNKWLSKIWELIALSIAAQITTFPLSIYYFHQFPVYFLLGNLFIAIPLFLIMILGMLLLVPYTDWLSPIFEWIISFTNHVLKLIAQLPYATISSLWINSYQLLLISLSLSFCIYALVKFRKHILILAVALYFFYSISVVYQNWMTERQRKIIFFSLRKNYAAAFISGKNAIIVTDLSRNDKVYQFFIQPAIEQSQIKTTHFINLEQDTLIGNFIKKDHQIVFNSLNILIIGHHINRQKLSLNSHFTALWLSGNTSFNLNVLPKTIQYDYLLADASNKDYRLVTFKKFAADNRRFIHVLKKNPAYLINLNQ